MIQIDRAEMKDENGTVWELGYYVRSFNDSGGGQDVYGIKIERVNIPVGCKESEETYGITRSFEEAEMWAKKMAAGTVTPVTLHDIVDDLY